jgi:hypothetical protein
MDCCKEKGERERERERERHEERRRDKEMTEKARREDEPRLLWAWMCGCSPYKYGFAFEQYPTAAGDGMYENKKWYTLGRVAHELAYVRHTWMLCHA